MSLRLCATALLFFLGCQNSNAQHLYDTILKSRLDRLMAADQRYRQLMVLQPGHERDSIARALGIPDGEVNQHFSRLQDRIDSINMVEVEAIFQKSGYPGKSMVGEPANEAAYYIIQHSDKIRNYFPLIEAASRKGELRAYLAAMMQDRLLKEAGKEQIYGTQFAGFAMEDSVTHQKKITWFLWPVKNYESVNERRKRAGFADTVAENAASQGIELRVLTLAEVKKKYPWFFQAKD